MVNVEFLIATEITVNTVTKNGLVNRIPSYEMKPQIQKSKRGAPLLFSAKLRRVMVTLDPDTIERAKKLSGGNLSAGIRKALSCV